eukprot:jgi/Orpsp1_1/1177311/evm.model.c7180000060935.1
MQFKTIFNTLFLTFLCLSVYAAPSRNDCKELKTALSHVEIDNCIINEKGELTEFDFYDEYSNCNGLNNGISNLKSIEELNIKSFRGTVAPNILKDLKSLKIFTYDAGDYHVGHLSQENINELSSLPNLEKIMFEYVDIDEEKLDFKPLQKLKLSSLILKTNGKHGISLKGLISNIKNLKELTISGFDIVSQEEFDTITSSNIKKLTLKVSKDVKTENFKNLKNLTFLNLTMKDVKDVPESVKNIPNLKTLIFNGKEITLSNKNENENENENNVGNFENEVVGNTNTNSNTNITDNTHNKNSTKSNGNITSNSDSNSILLRVIHYLPLFFIFMMF